MGNEAVTNTKPPTPINIDRTDLQREPTQNNNPKPQDRDTITCCCSPCFQGMWGHIRNFFLAIWNFFCCKSKAKSSVETPSSTPERTPRNSADELLKNQYENTEKEPDYQGLKGHVLNLPSQTTRYPYTEFLLELTDVEYEPKRKAVTPDLIKEWIYKIGIGSRQEEALVKLCDTCAAQRDYSTFREQLKKVDEELRPVPVGPSPDDEKQHENTSP